MNIMSDLRQRVEAELEGGIGVLSKILQRQFLDFEEVETTAEKLGYTFEYHAKIPRVNIYRETSHPSLPLKINELIDVFPNLPSWLEEDDWIETFREVVRKYPNLADLEAIDIISPLNKELNLSVWYSREEDGQEVYSWKGRIHSIQSMNDLLRKPPEDLG